MLPPNKDYSKHLFANSTLCPVCAREGTSTYGVISERYSAASFSWYHHGGGTYREPFAVITANLVSEGKRPGRDGRADTGKTSVNKGLDVKCQSTNVPPLAEVRKRARTSKKKRERERKAQRSPRLNFVKVFIKSCGSSFPI